MKEDLHPHREHVLTPACPGSWPLISLKLSSLLTPEGWDEPKPLGWNCAGPDVSVVLGPIWVGNVSPGHVDVILCRAQGLAHLSVTC